MSKQRNSVLSLQLKLVNGKLEHVIKGTKAQYESFVSNLEEGQIVDVFFDSNKDTGTFAQLSKIHACIREIAVETGQSFDEIKLRVKELAGLCWRNADGEFCKSFAQCSVEELGLAIEAVIEIGDFVNINFRQVFPQKSHQNQHQ
jgi:hypothetical protein